MKIKHELNIFVTWLINTTLVGFILLSVGIIFLLLQDIAKNYLLTNEFRPTDIFFIIISIAFIPFILLAVKFYKKINPKSKITERIDNG